MAENLTAFLFEASGAGWPEPGRPVSVSPGHVLLDEEGGVVALLDSKKGAMQVELALSEQAPFKIAGLMFKPMIMPASSSSAVGFHAGFGLPSAKPRTRFSRASTPERIFAAGSNPVLL